MEKTIVTTGKTIDLAVEAALAQLQLDRDSVSVMVLENAKSGFLGIGASPAKIQVTYEAPDEVVDAAPKSALSAASRSRRPAPPQEKQNTPIVSRPGKKPAPSAPAKTPQSAPAKPAQEARRAPVSASKPQSSPAPKAPRVPRPAAQAPAAPKTYEPAPEGSTQARIEEFLTGLMQHMGAKAVPHAYMVEDGIYKAELVGNEVGMLIGRRGDTLDAIQYLTSYAVNRGAETRVRVSVDAGDYRFKREESLRHLATRMAGNAVKYRRNFTLEPMNAYERHVIHAALQDYPAVTTFSTGTEPHRRIVIAFAKGAAARAEAE